MCIENLVPSWPVAAGLGRILVCVRLRPGHVAVAEHRHQCLKRVKSGKAQDEQITSGLPATADIGRTSANDRKVP
jgi:hypothetical protein